MEEVVEDNMIWKDEQNGIYSVKSGYRLRRKSQANMWHKRVDGNWSNMWNIIATPRAKHLLWKICMGCLPSRSRPIHHYVQCLIPCLSCEIDDEDVCHVFFRCNSMVQGWRTTSLSSMMEPRIHYFNDVKSLILDICSREDKRDVGRFDVMVNDIWKNRNNIFQNDTREEATKIVLQAYFNWHDWFSARGNSDRA